MGDALSAIQSLDAVSTRSNALAQIDPRARILTTLTFIVVVVSFGHYTVLALVPFALFPVVLGALGDIPFRRIAHQVLMASPFAIMMGIFNPLLDPAPLVILFGVPISGGWVSLTSILLRFALTVSAALVLVVSTGLQPLCRGLEQLGVPHLFTMQLMFFQRYALILAGEASRMRMAHALRAGASKLRLSTYASLLGHLLLRSLDRSQRIHQAMIARGFEGSLQGSRTAPWRTSDSIFLVVCISAFGVARFINLPDVLGRWLLGLAG
jgi:cobalt/nickel transport system permease protein